MSSRSGQEPVETNPNHTAKTDFGAEAHDSVQDASQEAQEEHDLARSSTHVKTEPAPDDAPSAQAESAAAGESDEAVVASVGSLGETIVPLPAPKSNPQSADTHVVVTQGEQKTALTTDEEALSLMPPGPDFAADVQEELVRIGCYPGRVDNIWGPMSRNAVARFNRVAKAKLPLKQPTRALLSSVRQAPDNYCTDAENNPAQVAALELDADLENLKNRPKYLPPWMRGEPMPEPDENLVETADQPEASPESNSETESSATAERSRDKPKRTRRARPSRTQRANTNSRRAQRRQVRRRQARRERRRSQRSRPSYRDSLAGWPGSGMGR